MFLKISVLYADNNTLTTRNKNGGCGFSQKTDKQKKGLQQINSFSMKKMKTKTMKT